MQLKLFAMSTKFLSTPSARRATSEDVFKMIDTTISIHALREEGDCTLQAGETSESDFYPRPPRGGRLKQT